MLRPLCPRFRRPKIRQMGCVTVNVCSGLHNCRVPGHHSAMIRLSPTTVMLSCATAVAIGAMPAPADAQDWLMWRGNAQRQARQSLGGEVDRPAVIWSLPVGGQLGGGMVRGADADLDGSGDVLLIRGGRLIFRRPNGALAWATEPLGLDRIFTVTDFDSDGRPDLLVGSQRGGVAAIAGATGAVLWQQPGAAAMRLGTVLPLDADGDGRLELYVADAGCGAGGTGGGRILYFDGGWTDPVRIVTLVTSGHGYWCGEGQQIGDVDGDGAPEIVTLSDDRIITYDPRTGRVLEATPAIGSFPFGQASTTVADIDGDGRDEIVIASNNPGGRFPLAKRFVLAEDEGSGLVVRFERDFHPTESIHQFPALIHGAIEAGGVEELATSYFDPDINRWRVVVVAGDAPAFEPRVELLGSALQGLVDIDGDGLLELVVQEAASREIDAFGRIRALRLEGGAAPHFTELFSLDGAQLPTVVGDYLESRAAAVTVGTRRGLILFRDADGDGRSDALLRVAADGTVLANRALNDSSAVAIAEVEDNPEQLLLTRTDGTIELLDANFRLLNDSDGDDIADLSELSFRPRVASVGGEGPQRLLLVVDAADRLRAFDMRTASLRTPPSERWRAEALAAGRLGPQIVENVNGAVRVVQFERLVSEGLSVALRSTIDGSVVRRIFLSPRPTVDPLNDVVPLRRADGSVARLVAATRDQISDEVVHTAIDPATGDAAAFDISRVVTGNIDGPATALDRNASGYEDYFLVRATTATAVDGESGTVAYEDRSAFAGTLAIEDLDDDGTLDILHGGSSVGPRGLQLDFAIRWRSDVAEKQVYPAAVLLPAGYMSVAAASLGRAELMILRGSDGAIQHQVVLASGRAFATAAAADAVGAVQGELSDVVAADDLAGTGRPAFVVGSSDGYLYAVDAAAGSLLWSINLRAWVSAPVIADLDGDGISEILAMVGDGHLYGVGQAGLDPSTAVYDTDGTFLAAGPADDLDRISSSSSVGGNWEPIAGAEGYEYQLLTSDGVVVVPFTDVGSEQRFLRDDLVLQLGRRYVIAVRAYAGGRASPEAVSDGFVVVDSAAPEVDLEVVPTRIFPRAPDGEDANIHLTASDAVGLDRYRLEIRTPGGSLHRVVVDEPFGGLTLDTWTNWNGLNPEGTEVPTGIYRVVGIVVDRDERETTVDRPLIVCGVDGVEIDECATTLDGGIPHADAGVADGGPWQVRGGGCGCRVGMTTSGTRALWPLLGLLMLASRGRRETASSLHAGPPTGGARPWAVQPCHGPSDGSTFLLRRAVWRWFLQCWLRLP